MAQNSSAAARITAYVDESSLTTLKGNVPHLARAEYDQGAAPASTQLTNVRLVLSRSAEQQAALDKYLAELQDKSSPNYHKWLTPAQFGALYGPADSDVAAITAWLESHGLTLETVSIGRTNIAFSGTVSQVEEAFHTSIHSFAANGQQFYSNTTDPKIPSALAAVVKGVAHLNTIKPKPQFMRGSAGKINPQTKRLERVNNESALHTLYCPWRCGDHLRHAEHHPQRQLHLGDKLYGLGREDRGWRRCNHQRQHRESLRQFVSPQCKRSHPQLLHHFQLMLLYSRFRILLEHLGRWRRSVYRY